jgi:hypothetical protein
MKPLPAPAYQATSCCSCLCPPTPEPVVLTLNPQAHLYLCLEDRRGSTVLEIRAAQPSSAEDPGESKTIRIGPTIWSAFWAAVQKLDQIMADL